MKRSYRHRGVSSFRDLKTIALDSPAASSSMAFHPNLSIRYQFGASKFLFFIIQAAPFRSSCNCLNWVKLAQTAVFFRKKLLTGNSTLNPLNKAEKLQYWQCEHQECLSGLRERSFLILDTRAEDLLQGHETCFLYSIRVRKH